MTDNPDHAIDIFALVKQAEDGNEKPLRRYLATEPTRAAIAGHKDLLFVRMQYGTTRDGRWHAYSTQPQKNPWPASAPRLALALLRCDVPGRRLWYELTIPSGLRIDSISADGEVFHIQTASGTITVSADQMLRVIADCAFGPPGFSTVEIALGFDRLAGRIPLAVVGLAEPGSILGAALPLALKDPALGWFKFRPQRPASYSQIWEDGPTHELLADPSGNFSAALTRARGVLPTIATWVEAGARLVNVIRPEFCAIDNPRLRSTSFSSDGRVLIFIDEGRQNNIYAELALDADDGLRVLEVLDVTD